jgi:isocitrate dehydrogenase
MSKQRITVAYGDGIGPEIMDSTIKILDAAGADLEYDVIETGEKVYLQGHTSGISPDSWGFLKENKIFLKSPITTPQGSGYKSLNVTIRKTLGLFANVRPCSAYTPYVKSHFPKMDLVVIRENEEDLYAGIEHRQTQEVMQALKIISVPGTEKIVRYAFEYARANNRKKVTCMTKDNIMKICDGTFRRIFNEVGQEYPEIEQEHLIIDIGSALIAERPEKFDVIVTLNLYGDIISDIAAQVAGSVGLGGSSNVGEGFAMFEAIHGSAPDIAGQDKANPSGLINGAVMMLVHLGKTEIAAKIQNALLKTLEDGIHTGDIYNKENSTKLVGTKEFTDAIIARLGQKPSILKVTEFNPESKPIEIKKYVPKTPEKKELVGVDIFVCWDEADRDPNVIGDLITSITGIRFKLKMITNRGVKVYPNGMKETFCTDHWRCRFVSIKSMVVDDEEMDLEPIAHSDIVYLLDKIERKGLEFIKIENLYNFDGKAGYSLGQGE